VRFARFRESLHVAGRKKSSWSAWARNARYNSTNANLLGSCNLLTLAGAYGGRSFCRFLFAIVSISSCIWACGSKGGGGSGGGTMPSAKPRFPVSPSIPSLPPAMVLFLSSLFLPSGNAERHLDEKRPPDEDSDKQTFDVRLEPQKNKSQNSRRPSNQGKFWRIILNRREYPRGPQHRCCAPPQPPRLHFRPFRSPAPFFLHFSLGGTISKDFYIAGDVRT